MKSFRATILGNEVGTSTTSVLVFASAIAVGTATIISNIRENKKAAQQESVVDSERRANEAALQTVSQLINTGSLFFNSSCGAVEVQVDGAKSLKSGNPPYTRAANATCEQPATATYALSCPAASAGDIPRWRYARVAANADVQCFNDKGFGKKMCDLVDVCVPVEELNVATGKKETQLQPVRVLFERDKPVEVTGSGKAQRVERRLAIVKAQRPGRNLRGLFFSSLKATLNFGAVEDRNRGLAAKYGATDTCFFMKPAVVKTRVDGNIAFKARSKTGDYSLTEIEPREDGPLADEYQRAVYLDEFQDRTSTDKYSVLAGVQDKFFEAYKGSDRPRGARPIAPAFSESASQVVVPYKSAGQVLSHHQYSGDRANEYFVGVMPQKGAQGGPEFEHFLSGSKSRYKFWFPDERDSGGLTLTHAEKLGDMKNGCLKSAKFKDKGGADPDFCTRVRIPFKEHKVALHTKCKSVPLEIPSAGPDSVENANDPKPREYFASRAVQVQCDPRWVDLVQRKILEEREALGNINNAVEPSVIGKETTADMVVQALEVDDEFLEGNGKWAKNPKGSGKHPIRAAYDEFVAETMSGVGYSLVDSDPKLIKFVGDKDVANWATRTFEVDDGTGTGNTITQSERYIQSVTRGAPRKFTVYQIDNIGKKMALETHKSETCAYFAYFKAAKSTECSYNYTTNQEASYVCRNNDGCFDESTLIRMADGTDRKVTELSLGEFVYNPVTKMPAKIVKLTIGPEFKPLIQVTVDGKLVKVTDSHPFMTKRGWVQARDLTTQDLVRSGRGDYKAVNSVRIGASGRTVANLALEGPADMADLHYVLADGVVTGDLVIQNMLELKAVSSK
ncbi:MAG: hypothetical protein RJB13_304 [Pseudomonadota bacterium]